MNNELTILSFGGGQDSTTILYKYLYDAEFRSEYAPNKFLVVMSDTGDEHPSTYKHIEYVKSLCEKNFIEFVLIIPDMGFHYENWQSLRSFYKLKNAIGSKAFPKTCTDKLKLQPIYKFIENWLGKNYGVTVGRKKGFYEFAEKYEKINILLGIAAGEERRVADPNKLSKWQRLCTQAIYPLIEIGYDRSECHKYIKSVGHEIPMPSNCMLCPFLSEIELLWLYKFYPEDYKDWVQMERNKLDNNLHLEDRNLGVWGKKTLPEILKRAQEKYKDLTKKDLIEYKMSHGHCVMTKY